MSDWIKINHSLLRSPEVRRLMRELKCNKCTAAGVMLTWLTWFDEQTTDGKSLLRESELDEEIGFRGGVAAMISIGWAARDEEGLICAVDFDKHCGETAKKRAQDARRKSLQRERERGAEDVTEMSRSERDAEETEQRDQKRKEEKRINKPSERARAHELPEDSEAVEQVMRGQAICGLKGEELATCAASFFDEMEACGWVTAKGHPVTDWHALARSYLRKWQSRAAAGLRTGGKITRREDKEIDYTAIPE